MLLNIYVTITLDYFLFRLSNLYQQVKRKTKIKTFLLKQLYISQIQCG